MDKNNCLILFAKNPDLGKVKTRIAEVIGDDKALEIYWELLSRTFKTISELPYNKTVFVADGHSPFWDEEFNFLFKNQIGKDLGERMENSFKSTFEKGFTKIVLIGSDCYELTNNIINEAFSRLDKYDCVLGPAVDGGYYLIGMKQKNSSIFIDIEWSTEKTLSQTISKIEIEGFSYFLLNTLSDVDNINDVLKYDVLTQIAQKENTNKAYNELINTNYEKNCNNR